MWSGFENNDNEEEDKKEQDSKQGDITEKQDDDGDGFDEFEGGWADGVDWAKPADKEPESEEANEVTTGWNAFGNDDDNAG